MEATTSEKLKDNVTTACSLVEESLEDISSFKDQYQRNESKYNRTVFPPKRLSKSEPSYDKEYEAPPKIESLYRETIRKWWIGHVVEIYDNEGYFIAELQDLEGTQSIAEFDINTVFKDFSDIAQNLFEGAEFAFYVVTEHGPGRPVTKSAVEFSSPHIWREEDNEKVTQLYSELFPDDPQLEG